MQKPDEKASRKLSFVIQSHFCTLNPMIHMVLKRLKAPSNQPLKYTRVILPVPKHERHVEHLSVPAVKAGLIEALVSGDMSRVAQKRGRYLRYYLFLFVCVCGKHSAWEMSDVQLGFYM